MSSCENPAAEPRPEVGPDNPVPSATQDEQLVAELAEECAQLRLTEADLDEVVLDALHAGASEAVNLSGDDFTTVFEQLHGDADEAATEINNGGLRAQLAFLVRAWGAPVTRQALQDLAV